MKEVKCPNCGLSQPVPPNGLCISCQYEISPPDKSYYPTEPDLQKTRQFPTAEEPAPSGRRSPLFWVFVIGGGILALMLIAMVVLAIIGYNVLNNKILTETPLDVEIPAYEQRKIDEVTQKFEEVREALNTPGSRVTLEVTPEEINILASTKLSGDEKVYFEIEEGNLLHFRFTSPYMDTEKYLNFDVRTEIEIKEHILELNIHSATIGEVTFPKEFLKGVSIELNDEILNNPDFQKIMNVIENAHIEEGTIFLDLLSAQESI
jgi:hypothetical protein